VILRPAGAGEIKNGRLSETSGAPGAREAMGMTSSLRRHDPDQVRRV
jgi:hypothetical protein